MSLLMLQPIRRWLLKKLGVRQLIEQAFREGWKMHSDTDPNRVRGLRNIRGMRPEELIKRTRTWRSLDEAWVNSDAEEIV